MTVGGGGGVPSRASARLGRQFDALLAGYGFGASTTQELTSGGCVVDRSAYATRPDGGSAFLDVLQLRRPVGLNAFPIGQVLGRRHLEDGSEELGADFDQDGSRVSVILVRRDGLLIRVSVASAHASNVAGWPTTMYQPPAPHTPAALTPEQVTAVVENLVGPAGAP